MGTELARSRERRGVWDDVDARCSGDGDVHVGVAAAADPTAEPWTHHFTYPVGEEVRSIAFDPGGETLFVHLNVPAINVWQMLVHFWPEVLGGILGLLTIMLLWRVWRVRRTAQARDEPHCRRCNYNLTGQVQAESGQKRRFAVKDGARCPECGSDLMKKRPRPGRSAWRRLAVIVPLWMATALLLGLMAGLRVPRDGELNQKFHWMSSWLADLASEWQIGWLQAWQTSVGKVLAVELTSGRVSRTVAVIPEDFMSALEVTPDGRFLLVRLAEGLVKYRIATGRRVGVLTGVSTIAGGSDSIDVSVIGYSKDGQTAHVQWMDKPTATGGVTAWNMETGSSEVLVRTPVFVDPNNRNFVWGRHFHVRGQAEPPLLISRPDFMEVGEAGTFNVRHHKIGSDEYAELQVSPAPESIGTPALSPDGRTMIMSSPFFRGLMEIDLETGRTVREFDSIGSTWSMLAMSRDGEFLLAGLMDRREAVGILDVKRGAWARFLAMPQGLYAPVPWISDDNRWVAAVCQKGGGAPGNAQTPFTHELVIWDLNKANPAGQGK